jgi:hypothetical protein
MHGPQELSLSLSLGASSGPPLQCVTPASHWNLVQCLHLEKSSKWPGLSCHLGLWNPACPKSPFFVYLSLPRGHGCVPHWTWLCGVPESRAQRQVGVGCWILEHSTQVSTSV